MQKRTGNVANQVFLAFLGTGRHDHDERSFQRDAPPFLPVSVALYRRESGTPHFRQCVETLSTPGLGQSTKNLVDGSGGMNDKPHLAVLLYAPWAHTG